MDQDLRGGPAPYDYRQYDRIWQRVAPSLDPYPVPAAAMASEPQTPEADGGQQGSPEGGCCMGAAARGSLNLLTDFIEDELADRRYYQAFAAQAPACARATLAGIARDEGGHAKTLMAVYYLITGEAYDPGTPDGRIYIGPWRRALRERYHAEACGGLSYSRAAAGTADPCLKELLGQLSADEYRHAGQILALLARSA